MILVAGPNIASRRRIDWITSKSETHSAAAQLFKFWKPIWNKWQHMSPCTLNPCRVFSHYIQLSQPMRHARVPDRREPAIVKPCFSIRAPSQRRKGSKLESVSFPVETSHLASDGGARNSFALSDWFLTEASNATRKTTKTATSRQPGCSVYLRVAGLLTKTHKGCMAAVSVPPLIHEITQNVSSVELRPLWNARRILVFIVPRFSLSLLPLQWRQWERVSSQMRSGPTRCFSSVSVF